MGRSLMDDWVTPDHPPKIFSKNFKKPIDNDPGSWYTIDNLKKGAIQCFTNTSSEDAYATSPQRLSKSTKRSREQSKMSAERGKTSTEPTAERVRAMTRSIGQSTLTSTKIATEYALATELDSELFGAWQQKPIKKNF